VRHSDLNSGEIEGSMFAATNQEDGADEKLVRCWIANHAIANGRYY
jgi:hypothetical protein